MSAARVITHRGFRGVLRDNSITGIMLAVRKGKFCEFDVLYVEGVWKACHDFGALSPYSADLEDLLILARAHNDIIVDVKWDWVWNRIDDLSSAIALLKTLLLRGDTVPPFWLQACDPHVLKAMRDQGFHEQWKIGMIVSNTDQFDKHKDSMDYAMIPLHELRPEDVERMSKERELIGFTCRKPEQLPLYKHLLPFIRGIVCDVSV